MKNSLIIPVYNEALVIKDTLRAFLSAFDEQKGGDDWEIVVIENASDDETGEAAAALKDDRIRVVSLIQKGKGRAIREGFASSHGEIVGFTDADLSIDPHEVINAFRLVKNDPLSIVVGSRLHSQSLMSEREWWRILSSVFFNLLARIIVGIDSTDAQCPLKVMHRDMQEVILKTKEKTWFLDLEFLVLSNRLGKKVVEVPIKWNEHHYPNRKSKLSIKDCIPAVMAMFRIRNRFKNFRHSSNKLLN